MAGMNRTTGRAITDERAHIRQSVTDILTTLVGTRVMRRDYGSVLPLLIDQPLNDATLLRAYSATVIALMRWEPRLQIQRITREVDSSQPGRAVFSIEALTQQGALNLQVNARGATA